MVVTKQHGKDHWIDQPNRKKRHQLLIFRDQKLGKNSLLTNGSTFNYIMMRDFPPWVPFVSFLLQCEYDDFVNQTYLFFSRLQPERTIKKTSDLQQYSMIGTLKLSFQEPINSFAVQSG